MREFEHFPEDKKCILCGKSDDKPCRLIPIDGTESGNNIEATPVHSECIKNMYLRYSPKAGIVYAFQLE